MSELAQTSLFAIDLDRPMSPARCYAMQGESGIRYIGLVIKNNNLAWTAPGDCRVEVRYTKPDGTGGTYDTLPDGSAAFQSSILNIHTVGTVPQMFTVPGEVKVSVAFIQEEKVLYTFPIVIEVIKCPGVNVKSENYENLSPYLKKTGWTTNMYLGTDALGNVVPKEAPEGLTEEQAAKLDVISVTEDGYTDISGLRRMTNFEVIENGNTITLNYTLEGGEAHTDVMNFDENGYPVSIVADGFEATGTWTVAGEAAADG